MKKEKDPIIYKTTNLVNNKIYIGQDSHNNPNYLGSGVAIINAIKKYGRDKFKKEILEHCSIEELNIREEFWVPKLDSTNHKIGYNLKSGGNQNVTFSTKTKEKMKNSALKRNLKGKTLVDKYGLERSIEIRNKLSKSKKGITLEERHGIDVEIVRKNMSISKKGKIPWNKGKTLSKDIKNKISKSLSGRSLSLEHKNNISSSNKGRICTKETRDKISKTEKITKQQIC